MSSNNKMKGLFKNIRLMFETEKEPEIQIGFPTDVKHVAHIGWDGPSVNSPSWMNEFKSPNGFATAPLASPGDVGHNNEPIQWSSEDKGRSNRAREQPEPPKSTTRRNMTAAGSDSPSREKTRTRRSSKSSSKDDPDRPRRHKEPTQQQDGQDLPDIPKTRRKKSKEASSNLSKSSRSKTKSQDTATSESGSVRSQASTATDRRNNSTRDSLEELEEAIS